MFNRKSIYALNKKDPDAIVYRGVMTALPRAACIMPTIRGAWQIG